ncbi:MAG: hypothetical protein HYZ27_08115, partial [Deltaproteobacteria bacterium]|nr:hypothetical protein [Deltaproteobacteria bacterium]
MTGRNLDELLVLLKGPLAPPTEKPSEQTEPAAPPVAPKEAGPVVVEPISLPVRVRVDRLAVSIAELRVERPDASIAFERAGMAGRFDGEGQALWLDLWLGLGEQADANSKSRLRVGGKGMPVDVDSEQRMDLRVQATGLGDLHATLGLAIGAKLGRTAKPVPPVNLTSTLDVATNLLAQRLNLNELSLRFNQGAAIDVSLVAEQLFTAPSVQIHTLSTRIDFTELAPLVSGFVPRITTGGRLEIDGKSVGPRTVEIALKLRDVRAHLPGTTVSGVSTDALLRAEPERAALHWQAAVAAASAAGHQTRDMTLTADVSTPLAPWLGGAAQGTVDAKARLGVAGVASAQANIKGVSVEIDARIPAALVLAAPSDEPLTGAARLRVREVSGGATTVQGLDLSASATLRDLAAKDLDAELSLAVRETALAQQGEPLALSNTRLMLAARQRGDDLALRRLRLTLADALVVDAQGEVGAALGPAPHFAGLGVDVKAEDLGRLLAVLPPSRRPLAALSGRLRASFRLDGRVPYKDLIRRATPPRPAADDVTQRVQSYADYLDTWRRQLATGLPFTASFEVALADVALADSSNELGGLALTTRFELQRHGPVLSNNLRVSEIKRPLTARDISHEARFV